MSKMIKENFKRTVIIHEIGPVQTFHREGKPSFQKCVLTLITADEQEFYAEIRNRKIKFLEEMFEGMLVNIEFTFAGSKKNGKRYNNIIINKINKA